MKHLPEPHSWQLDQGLVYCPHVPAAHHVIVSHGPQVALTLQDQVLAWAAREAADCCEKSQVGG